MVPKHMLDRFADHVVAAARHDVAVGLHGAVRSYSVAPRGVDPARGSFVLPERKNGRRR